MEENKFNEFYENRYLKEINWYDRKAIVNKQMYQFFQWSLIIFSALTPILVSLERNRTDLLGWVPIVTSFLVAIFASALKVFKFQEKWINYRKICETLRKEEHYYYADLYDYRDCDNKKSMFVFRVENLISQEIKDWINTSYKKKQEKNEV